ncbi:uncharacterized protein LOC128394169 [Panonychus citri]|uniref:uncharacterized protein LOC128394169 n=1 Tax=Panonychus citri TaxID=50023 RepID=UPI0023070960|nr:uncharacterized protein LOC128394169 [Panonychus citri]
MRINDLPNDCLLMIFDQFHDLQQFPKLMKVCSRWKTLIQIRLKKVKHFDCTCLDSDFPQCFRLQVVGKCVSTENMNLLEKIRLTELLPNVKTINFQSSKNPCSCSTLAHLLANANPIEGLCFYNYEYNERHKCKLMRSVNELITPFLGEIKVLATHFDEVIRSYFKAFGHLKKLRTLGNSAVGGHVRFIHVGKFSKFMTNLKTLSVYCDHESETKHCAEYKYKIPVLEKLQYLDIGNCLSDCWTLKFLNFCPNLQYLAIKITVYRDPIRFDRIDKNYNVIGLEITISAWFHDEFIIQTVEKFPNCRYLCVHSNVSESVEIEVIKLLPHLSTLVFGSDSMSKDPNNIQAIKDYCQKHNRQIDYYINTKDENLANNELHRNFHRVFYNQYSLQNFR